MTRPKRGARMLQPSKASAAGSPLRGGGGHRALDTSAQISVDSRPPPKLSQAKQNFLAVPIRAASLAAVVVLRCS